MNEPQYRLLNVGEECRADDEFFSGSSCWIALGKAGRITDPTCAPIRRRIDPQGWREIAKEKPVAPCVFLDENDGYMSTTHRFISKILENFWTHWLPLPPLPKPDEAEEAWKQYRKTLQIPCGKGPRQWEEPAFKAGWKARNAKG